MCNWELFIETALNYNRSDAADAALFGMTSDELNKIGKQIWDACFEVHKELGPGLLESVYVFALLKEFELRGIKAEPKITVPLIYKGYPTGKLYEMDILIEGEIVFEAKAVETMHWLYTAQMISYLKLTHKCLGYMVNFNVPRLKDGFKRFVNNF